MCNVSAYLHTSLLSRLGKTCPGSTKLSISTLLSTRVRQISMASSGHDSHASVPVRDKKETTEKGIDEVV